MEAHAAADDFHFLRTEIISVDAAVVGISKSRWEAIDASEASVPRAIAIMRKRRFDVLPIEANGMLTEFFVTNHWNDYSSIERRVVTENDTLPVRTPIRDVIKGFATEHRLFYFLVGRNNIVGLISVANLNSRPVKVYLFGLLSELEMGLGELIRGAVSEEDLVAMVGTEPNHGKGETIQDRFQADRDRGLDAHFVEYLQLSDLIAIARKRKLYLDLGYSGKSFQDGLEPLVNLRHGVCHPNRSIVTPVDSVVRLWRRIERTEDCLVRLRKLS
jgi:hypothetical protein